VLRVPAAALRFRPTADHFAALNLPVPPEIANRGSFAMGGGRGSRGERGGAASPAAAGTTPAAETPQPQAANRAPRPATSQAPSGESRGQGAQRGGGDAPTTSGARRGGGGSPGPESTSAAASGGARGGGGRGGFDPNMTPEERRKRMEERLASMTPEERQRWEERMRERGEGARSAGSGQGGRGQGPGQATSNRQGGGQWDVRQGITTRASGGTSINSGATTIDALFAPVVIPERPGTVWTWTGGQLKSMRIRYGISDGTWNEVLEGDLKEGQEVVTNITTGVESRTTPGQSGSQNPLMGPQRGGRGPGGGPGGGGRGGR
jgi:hypothetical protein